MKKTVLALVFLLVCGSVFAAKDPLPYLDAGEKCLEAKQYDKALQEFLQAEKTASTTRGKADLGKVYYAKGDYQTAIKYLKLAVGVDKKYLPWVTQAYYKAGNTSEAIVTAKKVLDLGPGSFNADDWKMNIDLCVTLGQMESLIFVIRKNIETDPKNPYLYVDLAAFYNLSKQYNEAVTAAQKAIELKQDSETAYNELGKAYVKGGRFKEAVKAFRKAVEINPTVADLRKNLAFYLMQMADYQQALDVISGLIALEGKNVNDKTLLWRAIAYYHVGRYREAMADVEQAAAAFSRTTCGMEVAIIKGSAVAQNVVPDGPAALAGINSGDVILKVNGQQIKRWGPDKFKQTFESKPGLESTLTIKPVAGKKQLDKKLISQEVIAPQAADILGLKSLIFLATDDKAMFSLTAAKALSLDQAAVIARLADGFLQLEEGKPEIAAKKFEALDLTNDYPLGWDQKIMGQAQALASLERYDEAVEVYMSGRDDTLAVNAPAMLERGKFIEIIRPQIDAWKAKADQCIAENRFQEALTILTRVLALSDSDEPAIRKKIFETAGKMTTAAEISEEARKYMLRAEILAKDNDLIGAVTELRHAIKRAPFAANLYYNASVHYGNLEKYAEAIRYMKLYLEAAPDSPSSRAVKDKVIEWELLLEKKGR